MEMKWTVLSDNRSNDSRFETEHGLSILLETAHHRILLDTGAGDVFIHNAERMGIDLNTVDYVFISHGHSDHAGGLRYLMGSLQFKVQSSKFKVIVSPHAVSGKFFSKRKCLHSITTQWPEGLQDRFLMADQTCEIAEGLHILAHIPQNHPMPQGNRYLFVQNTEGDYVPDDFSHELALYTEGLLFTGCAHSGVENILAACPWPVDTVVGGFHLLDDHETEEELSAFGQRLRQAYPQTQFFTSHCTGSKVFAILHRVMGNQIQPFCCGTKMECAKL